MLFNATACRLPAVGVEIDGATVIGSIPETATMDDLELTGIRVFREIVESGSFTGAASRLGLAPSMVSKHVARLEGKLGARLLHRSSRRLSLTEAGSLFFEQGRQALELLDTAVAAVGQAGAPRGDLKISAPVWCATPAFVRLLRDYRAAFPEVRLDLHLDSRIVDIVSEGFDVAVRTTAEPSPALIARPLCNVTFHLVATADYLERARREQAGDTGAPTLHIILPNYVQFDRLKAPTLVGPAAARWETVMKSSDTTLTHQAVLAGMGAAFLPGWVVDGDLAAGRLVALDGPQIQRPVFAVYASRRHMPAKLRSFIDFLVERLGGDAAPASSPG